MPIKKKRCESLENNARKLMESGKLPYSQAKRNAKSYY